MTFNKNFRKPKTSKKKHYDKCAICMQSCKYNVHRQTCCKQVFHKSCLDRWTSSCPLCRTPKITNLVSVRHRFYRDYYGIGLVEEQGQSTSPYYEVSIIESDYPYVKNTHFFFVNIWQITPIN
jgi:hypothetical protein